MVMEEVYRGFWRCDSCLRVRQSSGRCERYKKGVSVSWRGVMVTWEAKGVWRGVTAVSILRGNLTVIVSVSLRKCDIFS